MCRAIDATGRIARSHMWPPHAAATPREGTGPRKDIQRDQGIRTKTIRDQRSEAASTPRDFCKKNWCNYVLTDSKAIGKPISTMWSAKDIDVSWISQVSKGRMNPIYIGIFTSKRMFSSRINVHSLDSSGSIYLQKGSGSTTSTTNNPKNSHPLGRAEV